MFNLDKAISDWRLQMAANGMESPELLDELEGHLREEVAQRTSSGATEQAAFESAVECFGRPEALGVEFEKVRSKEARHRFLRICRYIFAACVLLINTRTLLEYEISPLERIFGISAVSVICLCMAFRPRLVRFLPSTSRGQIAKALKLAASLLPLWPILALLDALHLVHLGLGIVATVVLWCLLAALAMIALEDALNPRFRGSGGSGGPFPPFQPRGQPVPPTRPQPPELAATLPPSRPVDPVVREALELAGDEANRLGHDYVGTEHVLLALLRLARGSFAGVLQRMNLDREIVRREVERLVSPAPIHMRAATLRLTPRASRAVKLAAREAKAFKHPSIAAEHVFLGLLIEGSGVAAVVLRKLGIHIEQTREEISREVHTHPVC